MSAHALRQLVKNGKILPVILCSVSAGFLLVFRGLGEIAWAETHPHLSRNNPIHIDAPKSHGRDCARPADSDGYVHWSILLAEFDCGLGLPIDDLSLNFSYAERVMKQDTVKDAEDIRKYLSGETNNIVRSSNTLSLLGRYLKAEFDLAHTYTSREEQTEPFRNGGIASRIGFKGESGGLRYWAGYGYFGREFRDQGGLSPQDQAGGNLGAELDLGIVNPKIELARSYNNIADDSDRSRTITSAGKLSLDVKVPQWPVLTLTYGRELKETSARPEGRVTEVTSTDTLSGTLWYGRSTWDAYVTSSYSLGHERLNADSEKVAYYYMLGGSYRPIEGLSIDPSIEFTQTIGHQNDYRYETLSANLGIYYSIADSLSVTVYGSFIADQDSDGYVDTQNFAGSFGLIRNLGHVFGLPENQAVFSFKLNYNQYIDHIYPNSDSEAYSALLLFEVIL